MKQLLVLICILVAFFSCKSNRVYDKLNGNWTNKDSAFSITINANQNNYYGSSKGNSFTGTFGILREENNTITLRVGKQKVLATLISDKDLSLQTGNNQPIRLQKTD